MLTRRSFITAAAAAGFAASIPSIFATAACAAPLPEKWDESHDVVVVGSGFAGMSAAASACAAGADTVVFDKMPVPGGNSAIAGGGYACWTDKLKLREKHNAGEDSEELHRTDIIRGGDYYNMPELAAVLAKEAPATYNWMLDEGGLVPNDYIGRVGGHSAYRDHMASGPRYLAALTKIAQKNGFGEVRLRSRVTRIHVDPATGAVAGVEVETGREKKKINVQARKGVILATGGFGADVEFRTRLVPNLTAAYNTTNQPGATSESLRMAQDIGADSLHLAFIQLYPSGHPETGAIDRPALFPTQGPAFGAFFTDENGKRFVSELQRRDVVAQAEVSTGGKKTWCILNKDIVPKISSQDEIEKLVASGRVKMGRTIEELAAAMGVPAANLKETLDSHNGFVAAGKDPQFGKPITKAMFVMNEGPYYAVGQWPSVHHCQGGLRINTKAQVISIHGKPIEGLFAAGEATGGVHGNNRLGGNAIADCIVFGRIAGATAAAR